MCRDCVKLKWHMGWHFVACEAFHAHNPFNQKDCHQLNNAIFLGTTMRHMSSSAHLVQENWTNLRIYRCLCKLSHNRDFEVLCLLLKTLNSTHWICWSVQFCHWSVCLLLWQESVFTQRFAELPSCNISIAQQVLQEEATLLILKIQHKVAACPSLNLLKVVLWK